jgi:hypothetical protein
MFAPTASAGMMSGTPQSSTRGYMSPNSQVQLNSGFDAVQPIQDAWMGRLQPQMDQARQAEMARLKAQGISENSGAWARSMDTLNRNDVDARNQALLAGAQENNNIFNRGLAQNNQVFGQAMQGNQMTLQQRQQLMEEAMQPYRQLGLLSGTEYNPIFGGSGQNQGTDYFGAGQNTYLGNLGNYNAETAAKNGMIGGIGQLGGGLIQAGQTGGWGGGSTGGMLGGLGDFLKIFGIGG